MDSERKHVHVHVQIQRQFHANTFRQRAACTPPLDTTASTRRLWTMLIGSSATLHCRRENLEMEEAMGDSKKFGPHSLFSRR